MYTHKHTDVRLLFVVMVTFAVLTAPVFAAGRGFPGLEREKQAAKAAAQKQSASKSKTQNKKTQAKATQKKTTAAKTSQSKKATSSTRKTQKQNTTTRKASATSTAKATTSKRVYGTKTTPARQTKTTVQKVSTATKKNSTATRPATTARSRQTTAKTKTVTQRSASKTNSTVRTVTAKTTQPAAVKTTPSSTGRTSSKASRRNVTTTIARSRSTTGVASTTPSQTVTRATKTTPKQTVTRVAAKTSSKVSADRARTTQSTTSASKSRDKVQRLSASTRTVSRSKPIRVTDIKTQPDRVIVNSASKPSRRDTERTTVSASIGKDNLSLTAATYNTTGQRHSERSKHKPASFVYDHDRFSVKGKPSHDRPRPLVPRRLYRDRSCIDSDPHWYNHGSYFSFRWSSSSCGVALYLPFNSSCYQSSYYYRSYPGDSYGVSYYYPRYHRKYVFVSLGGYWPLDYRYRRYYWYGCHPHYWYGSNVVEPTTYTYNTYNYYSGSESTDASVIRSYYTAVDTTTDEIVDEPQYQTAADLMFDNAVTLFEAGQYQDAAVQFRQALLLSPDDVVLPFTYTQALFAAEDYAKAASVLRSALEQIPDDELTIYYPRGLYADDEVLVAQIEQLQDVISREPFASDYQLLLGYQYLGMGQLDKAMVYLPRAATDLSNRPAAEKLLELTQELKEQVD